MTTAYCFDKPIELITYLTQPYTCYLCGGRYARVGTLGRRSCRVHPGDVDNGLTFSCCKKTAHKDADPLGCTRVDHLEWWTEGNQPILIPRVLFGLPSVATTEEGRAVSNVYLTETPVRVREQLGRLRRENPKAFHEARGAWADYLWIKSADCKWQ